MTSDDLDGVEIATVSPAATQWLHPLFGEFLALPDRITLTCKTEAVWMAARDLIEGIIGLDPGNAIAALGINLHMVAVLDDHDASLGVWNALGDLLTPKEIWREALALPDKDGYPGLEGVKLSIPDPDPDLIGSRRVFIIEPVLSTVYNLTILVNNHFDITKACPAKLVDSTDSGEFHAPDPIGPTPAELSLQLLVDRFEIAISESREQSEAILSVALKQARSLATTIENRRAKRD